MATDCTPQALADSAKCIECGIPAGLQLPVLIYLMCQIANNGGGGGGGGVWGTITGILSNQVDLQNALNAKLTAASNLSDLTNAATARSNLGIGGTGFLVPSGTIVQWYGALATIPTGWVLCDGLNGTPDMQGYVPVGGSADLAGKASTTFFGNADPISSDNTFQQQSLALGTDFDAFTTLDTGSASSFPCMPFRALYFIMKT